MAVRLVHVEENTEDEAWRWLARHDEREYSFVDAISFAVMRRMRLRHALAFDGDLQALASRSNDHDQRGRVPAQD